MCFSAKSTSWPSQRIWQDMCTQTYHRHLPNSLKLSLYETSVNVSVNRIQHFLPHTLQLLHSPETTHRVPLEPRHEAFPSFKLNAATCEPMVKRNWQPSPFSSVCQSPVSTHDPAITDWSFRTAGGATCSRQILPADYVVTSPLEPRTVPKQRGRPRLAGSCSTATTGHKCTYRALSSRSLLPKVRSQCEAITGQSFRCCGSGNANTNAVVSAMQLT